jgi:hypothetical protein
MMVSWHGRVTMLVIKGTCTKPKIISKACLNCGFGLGCGCIIAVVGVGVRILSHHMTREWNPDHTLKKFKILKKLKNEFSMVGWLTASPAMKKVIEGVRSRGGSTLRLLWLEQILNFQKLCNVTLLWHYIKCTLFIHQPSCHI